VQIEVIYEIQDTTHSYCTESDYFSPGLGKGLVQSYLSRPNHIVIAAVRDPAKPDSQALKSLPVSSDSKLITVKIDSSSDTDAKEAIQSLQSTHAINKLDVVIANAGICEFHGSAFQASIQSLRDHLNVNTVGALIIFQATWRLLQVAASPKFVTMSSTLGSIGTEKAFPTPSIAYGSSKAALNWLTKSIHDDYAPLIAFPIHPG
jgi:norsolorinic acid ketoreductase